ncbi:SDR family NAD(P)-dependent oxidoreductase [Vibrio fluvialis]|uniref:Nucleoside-diphosphate-sugar epimerase n=1 Tax=Vibrio fluvialis TaxID=676 RepID=A0AAX2LLF7_VIBFL|nr:SDR family oxidoreductase [Vibrio fluvialis]AMF93989.1 SDR family NAD(P)-dependent oxidoreductase [Vibrio fluvialis]EKO4011362.1 SDR family oxidoreductase [Vibrio fluvialis]MBY8225428.1 SDR family oxidoreductase [Vibrio fluvialis]MCE7634378.1 SDR family oxidoreductase [Vibrio fluvialis]SUP22057.1 nucleoside-diphosphate-sugar epimerase [Vibrio fluvialis]
MNKVLVLGASGHVGQPLVAELLAKGEQVKAASRSGQAFGAAEGVVFDFADPTTFDAAFDGVDRAYVMLPGGYVESKALLEPVIQAAVERNVKVVFQSVLGVDADDSIPYRQVEIALENSGVPYVILRPNWFADNFHTYWKAGIDQGVIGVPAGEGKSSFIDVRDIASSAAAALTTNRFDNQAFNLTGPEALSYAQAAQKISEALGKPVVYQAMEEGAFCDLLKSVGVPADYAEFLTSIFYPVREGWTAGVSDAVVTLTGKAPRSLDEYIADHLAELR